MSKEQSILVPREAIGSSVSISTTSAQSGAINTTDAVVYSTADCFVMVGANPTATTSCAFVPASTLLRLHGWKVGEKLAFITASGTGTVYISPGA